MQLGGHQTDVGHLIAPPDDGSVVVVPGAAASALVVGDDTMILGEGEHLRQQVLMARGGPAPWVRRCGDEGVPSFFRPVSYRL